jgi:hypothetical protein
MLTEKAKQLIPKARIVSFSTWQNLYSPEIIDIFQQADDQGKYLSNADLEQIKTLAPDTFDNLKKAELLREKADKIVAQARQKVLEKFPNINEIGGELYPPERAEACWRDFWHFLRCISYGVAGKMTEFTSEEGLQNMQLLYEELKVPLPAMIVGLENLKYFSLQKFSEEEITDISYCFEHLINKLKSFV